MAKDFVTPEQYQRGVGKIKNYADKINDYHKRIDNAIEFEIVNGPISSISTYSQNKTNGDPHNMKYVNSNKIIDVTNTHGIPILISISDSSKYMYYKAILNGLEGSPYCCLQNIKISFYDNKTIQIKIYNKKNFDSSFNLVESNGCCISINYGGSVTDEQYKYLDSLNISILLLDYNYLTLDNVVEYIPKNDYNPTTKKYVDGVTNTLVKKDTNKYVLITNDDTLIIKKDSITDIADATVTINNLTGKFGTLVANDNGIYSYTLNTIMTDVETFTFKVNNVEQKLVIVPYREMKYDDSNAGITYVNGWSIEKNEKCYNGNVHVVTSSDTVTSKANFEFVGTGIEVFSLINNQTGRIQVAIWKQKDDGTYPKTAIYRRTINTNYTYSDVAYEFPIISFDNNEYGKYKIEITVGKGETFYLDSICIHNSIYNLNLKIQNLYQPINENTNILYTNKHNPVFTPSRIYDPTTKKYVDELVESSKTAMCTDEEINNMLNEVLGGDYSGN